MFTLEQSPNPLDLLVSHAGSSLVQRGIENQQMKRKSEEIKNGLDRINEDSSPLEVLQAINSLRIPDEDKKRLNESYEKVYKYKQDLGKNSPEVVEKEMIDIGMPKSLARTYSKGGQGERTEILKQFLDMQKRGLVKGKEPIVEEEVTTKEMPKSNKLSSRDKGLTPAELVKRQESRFKTQTPILIEDKQQFKNFQDESLKIDRLEQLNETDELPEGLWGRLNVDWENGKIRVPALATPEAQLFVKTVAEFLASAKDTFGSRVTNFDVSLFMQRLPSLANTKSGRDLILKQMKIINELNQLEKKSVLDVVDEYEGIRNIDYTDAQRKAEGNSKKKHQELIQEFKDLNGYFKRSDKDRISWAKGKTPKGYSLMESPDGEFGYVQNESVKEKISEGYKRL